ncbi:hypothetical protein QUB47_22700 [Microcoleus sp. AT9_B5]
MREINSGACVSDTGFFISPPIDRVAGILDGFGHKPLTGLCLGEENLHRQYNSWTITANGTENYFQK